MKRKFNFSPGPATLPLAVLKNTQKELLNYQNLGASILEISHRSKVFEKILNDAKEKILSFLNLKAQYRVLFLSGGASSEFFRIPMNLLDRKKKADYIETGVWAKKAIEEARRFGEINIIASSSDGDFNYIPVLDSSYKWSSDIRYVYLCSNNTIYGTQYHDYPDTANVPLIGDFTSDLFCRDIDLNRFGIIFAGIQKNFGPAGLSIVVIHEKLLDQCHEDLPSMCSYKVNYRNNSLFNTCPVFQIYFLNQTLDWMRELGGIEVIERQNRTKAKLLYERIGEFDLYQGGAKVKDRSIMNITWTLPNEKLTQKFLQGAEAIDLIGLKGHRLVGGIRASIYNHFPIEGAERLADYMRKFAKEMS